MPKWCVEGQSEDVEKFRRSKSIAMEFNVFCMSQPTVDRVKGTRQHRILCSQECREYTIPTANLWRASMFRDCMSLTGPPISLTRGSWRSLCEEVPRYVRTGLGSPMKHPGDSQQAVGICMLLTDPISLKLDARVLKSVVRPYAIASRLAK